MQEYKSENIRNVALVGHQGCGKTSLVEAMLFSAGATTRLGSISEKNMVYHTLPSFAEVCLACETSLK